MEVTCVGLNCAGRCHPTYTSPVCVVAVDPAYVGGCLAACGVAFTGPQERVCIRCTDAQIVVSGCGLFVAPVAPVEAWQLGSSDSQIGSNDAVVVLLLWRGALT